MTIGDGQQSTRSAPGGAIEPEAVSPAAPAPTRTGELIGGKYRIVRLLAQGGMGVVYEAHHEVVRRRFAVKFLRPDFVQRREFLGRFHREAQAAGALENEHIASAVDFGISADGSPFIVMEYLVGENLAALLDRERQLPVGRAADLCVQACHGAEAAHAAGILHRDLKPKNLFVGRRDDGTDLLKILDFGIAKLQPVRYDHTTTDTGTLIGTPAYMSPEQARGERTIDARSDVYALGTIFFEMLSGHLPHPGNSPNAVLYHITTQPAISLAATVPGLPGALVELVDRTLATDPDQRPQSAAALALGLAPFAERKEWPSRTGEATEDDDRAQPGRSAPTRRQRVQEMRQRSRWSSGLLLAALGVIVALGTAVLAMRSRKPAPAPALAAPATPTVAAPAAAAPAPAAATPEPELPSAAAPSATAMDVPDHAVLEPAAGKRLRTADEPGSQRHKRPAGGPAPSERIEREAKPDTPGRGPWKPPPVWDKSDIYKSGIYRGLAGAGGRPELRSPEH